MNFVHSLRSPTAPAEGSMERSHFVWLFSISRGGPLRRLHRLPHRNAVAWIKNNERKEVRHKFRVPILTSRSSPVGR